MIINKETKSFNSLFSAVGSVCFHNEDVLLLKRQEDKSFPNLWGVPTGKIGNDETPIQAIIRELYEETNIVLSADRLNLVDTFYVSTEEMSFTYTLYYVDFDMLPDVTINTIEHKEYKWIHVKQVEYLNLVPDVKETISQTIKKRRQSLNAQLNLFTNEPDNYPIVNFKLNDYLRKFTGLDKKFEIPKKWIVTFGAIGTGKTTIVKQLNKNFSNSLLIPTSNSILSKGTRLNFYLTEAIENKKMLYHFFFLTEVLTERFRLSFNAPNYSFVDETIFSTLAYSVALYRLGWLKKYEFETFMANYQFYLNFLPAPTKILYFYCSTETMIKRKDKRLERNKKREIEKNYNYNYLDYLNKAFREVSEELKLAGYDIIFIDTNEKSVDVVLNEVLYRIGQIWN
jgi:8-oxo-dGTP diphosphatase